MQAISPTYEQLLDADPRWALDEGSLFFEGKGRVQESLRRIAKRLEQIGVPYAVVGGMALYRHGFRRFTEDVDILVTREGLVTIHEQLEGLGYVPPFAKSKHLRDAQSAVKIKFLVEGGFPGDGKLKPVSFPNPADISVELDGIRYVNLETLINLKLASGMSNAARARDLTDVQDLIGALDLDLAFANRLHPYVQETFTGLWKAIHPQGRIFLRIWDRPLPGQAVTWESLIAASPADAALLGAMQNDGVEIEVAGDTVRLRTNDEAVARKYDMHPEDEFM